MPVIDDEDRGLVVPKRAVDVELELTGKPPRRVQVFVPEHGNHADQQRAVLALLEDASVGFLPCRDHASRQPVVFNKHAVVWIALVPGDSADEDDEELFDYQRQVRIELVGGQELAGELYYSLPADHARVADHLNGPSRFVRLWASDRLYLVNKTFVERVIEVPLDLEE